MPDHKSRKHAKLSASGAHRWMKCTASPTLEQKYPDQSSDFALEGTVAHELADIILSHDFGLIPENQYTRKLKRWKGHRLYGGAEMDRYVAKYVDYVHEKYGEAAAKSDATFVEIEERLDFSHIVPKGFGTGDGLIVSEETIYVIDLKYGRGVKVDAKDNPQLMLYGVGALKAVELYCEPQEVVLCVFQPRLNHTSEHTISVEELSQWAEQTVKPIAKRAYHNEDTEFSPGPHCRFCKAKHDCRALAEYNLNLAKHDFAPPETLSEQELLEIRDQLDTFETWVKAVRSHFMQAALSGHKWPGLKLVEGRSRRMWVDEENAIARLNALGYSDEEIMNRKIKGLTDIESMMSVDHFEEEMKPFVAKNPGKPKLVSEDDPRPEYLPDTPESDFSQQP